MNYLVAIVKSLSGREKIALLRKIKNQKLKLKLFNFIVENNSVDNVDLNEHLDYEKDTNSLYTLKNRLLDDILTVKQEFIRNEITEIKEQVQSLTPLLMSGEVEVLLRELKKLEKSAARFELYTELKEIYFCYLLVYNNSDKKTEKYKRQLDIVNKKIEIANEVEKLFYTRLINLHELFYYPNKKLQLEMRLEREKLHHYHTVLQNTTTRFYLACTDLLMGMGAGFTAEQAPSVYKNLQGVIKQYEFTFLKRRMPAWGYVLECLNLRYYYLVNDIGHFTGLQRSMYPDILKLCNHLLFSRSFVHFVHLTLLDYIKNNKPDLASAFISKTINEDMVSNLPGSLNAHYYYLLALKEYYAGNFVASSSLLLKARNYFKDITMPYAWVILNALLLNLINMLHQHEFLYIEHEISLLRRYFIKFQVDDEYIRVFNQFFRAVREYEKYMDQNKVFAALKMVQTETYLMKLIVPVEIMQAQAS